MLSGIVLYNMRIVSFFKNHRRGIHLRIYEHSPDTRLHSPPRRCLRGHRGKVRRNGKSVGVVDVDVFNDKMVLLAIGRATYSTLQA